MIRQDNSRARLRAQGVEALILDGGNHSGPEHGGCMMEWASQLAGEPWSSRPRRVSLFISELCVVVNDTLPSRRRNRILRPYVPKVIGTATGYEDDIARMWLTADWMVRTVSPFALRQAHLEDDSEVLEALPSTRDAETAQWAETTARVIAETSTFDQNAQVARSTLVATAEIAWFTRIGVSWLPYIDYYRVATTTGRALANFVARSTDTDNPATDWLITDLLEELIAVGTRNTDRQRIAQRGIRGVCA